MTKGEPIVLNHHKRWLKMKASGLAIWCVQRDRWAEDNKYWYAYVAKYFGLTDAMLAKWKKDREEREAKGIPEQRVNP